MFNSKNKKHVQTPVFPPIFEFHEAVQNNITQLRAQDQPEEWSQM